MGTRSDGVATGVMGLVFAGVFFGLSIWIRYGVRAYWDEVAILLVLREGYGEGNQSNATPDGVVCSSDDWLVVRHQKQFEYRFELKMLLM